MVYVFDRPENSSLSPAFNLVKLVPTITFEELVAVIPVAMLIELASVRSISLLLVVDSVPV
jgi:hypothetical protein